MGEGEVTTELKWSAEVLRLVVGLHLELCSELDHWISCCHYFESLELIIDPCSGYHVFLHRLEHNHMRVCSVC